MRRNRSLLFLLVVVAMLAAACADTEDTTTTTGVTTTAAAATTTTAEAATTTEAAADSGEVVIGSTQANPVDEEAAMNDIVLAGFNGKADFIPTEELDLITTMTAEAGAAEGSFDVVIALHGTYPTLADEDLMIDLTDLATELAAKGIPQNFLDLGKLGTDTQHYIPLMQATYYMGASNDALASLPEGADINAITWEQLAAWGEAIEADVGAPRLGFPADAENGLLHRFLEGYLYPSFTGGMVTTFKTAEAVEMWEFFRELWTSANPQSPTYAFIQEPLLSGEVLVGFDHHARLKDAFDTRPDDFVAFPAPTGPQGLGFMPVLVGVGIPKNAPNPSGAADMIRFLLEDATQTSITAAIGFFPVTAAQMPADVTPSVSIGGAAIMAQGSSPDALPALLPVGLGERGGEINKIYRDTFTAIVLNGDDIPTVLEDQGALLQALLDETGAPCWPPDPPSDGACQLLP